MKTWIGEGWLVEGMFAWWICGHSAAVPATGEPIDKALRSFLGRRVRITIEDITPEAETERTDAMED